MTVPRPLPGLLRAEHLVPRALALAALVPVAVLFASAWLDAGVAARTQLLLAAVCLITIVWPADGLLLTAALTPLQVVVVKAFDLDQQIRLAEAIVLAFLAGWLVRRIVSREIRPIALGRLGPPIWVWASVVVASLAVSVMVDPPPGHTWPGAGAAVHAAATRFLNAADFDPNSHHAAALLLEGLLLVSATTALAAARPRLARDLIGVVSAAAAVCAVFSVFRLTDIVYAALHAGGRVWDAVKTGRTSFFAEDLNASGSYFALCLCAIVGAATAGRGRTRVRWAGAGVLVAAALWLTGSRAAVGAAALVGVWHAARLVRRRGWPYWTIGAAAAAVIALVIVAVWIVLPGRYDSQGQPFDPLGLFSLRARWWFLTTSWAMWKTAPWFGIGVGGYYTASESFMRPELVANSVIRENAHNNFVQIAVELGVTGLASFLWLLVSAMRRGPRPTAAPDRVWMGVAAGLAAFLLSALVSHPLLVRPVAFAFWLMVAGMVNLARPLADSPDAGPGAFVTGTSIGRTGWVLVISAMVALAVSVPIRAGARAAAPGLTYGFGPVQVEPGTGVRFFWSEARSRLVIAPERAEFDLWLRAPGRGQASERPTVEVRVDGEVITRIRLLTDEWELVRVVRRRGQRARSWQIELRISPAPSGGAGRDAGVMVSEEAPRR